MRERLKIALPVIVEGKYDKIALSSVIDAVILTTGGFSVFNSKEKQALLRRLSANGVILLTDPDGGGVQIRSFLLGILPREKVYQLYIPKTPGKERRKVHAGKAGLLGVEGMEADLLYGLFLPFAGGNAPVAGKPVSKTDFFNDGLTGIAGATGRRAALCRALSLPEDMTPNALLEAVNLLGGEKTYREALARAEVPGGDR